MSDKIPATHVDLLEGPYLETRDEVCKAFRPKSAQRPTRAS